MVRSRELRLCALASFLCASALAFAEPAGDAVRARGFLHLNGYTHHFKADNCNDRLYGLGATWYTRKYGRVLTAWEGDFFQDSGRKLSAYAGHSWTVPLRFGEVGATAALMYHRNFKSQNRWRVLPVALPFVETALGRAKLRAYYIPPVRAASDHQVAVQLLVPMPW